MNIFLLLVRLLSDRFLFYAQSASTSGKSINVFGSISLTVSALHIILSVAVFLIVLLIVTIIVLLQQKNKVERNYHKLSNKLLKTEKALQEEKRGKSDSQLDLIKWKNEYNDVLSQLDVLKEGSEFVFANIQPQIWRIDESGILIDCNRFEYYNGEIPREKAINKSLEELLGNKYNTLYQKMIGVIENGNIEKGAVDSYIYKDKIYWSVIDMLPFITKDNKSVYVFIYDITQTKDDEDLILQLLHRVDNGIAIIQNSEIFYCNDRLQAISGYSKEELEGLHLMTLLSERAKKEIKSYSLDDGLKISVYGTDLITNENNKISVIVSYSDIQYQGIPSKLVVVSDVSKHEREQTLLSQQIAIKNTALEQIDLGVLIIDEDKNTKFNKEIFNVWNIQENISSKKQWLRLFKEFEKKVPEDKYKEWFENAVEDFETRLEACLKTSEKILKCKSVPYQIEGKKIRVWTFRDVTEIFMKTSELERQKKMAESASVTKTEFLANMSHEIRTPMNGILSVAKLLNKTDINQRQRRYVDIIEVSANSLLDLVNDILDISKIEAGYLKLENIKFSLNETLGAVVDILALRAEKKDIEIYSYIQPEIPQFFTGDPTRIKQILINLGNNAVKFTQEGYINIMIRVDKVDKDEMSLHFVVSDTGIGIKKDKIDKIFKSFEQEDDSTTRKFGGTGLGLTISRKLTEMMNGDIWVESEFGKGSDFHFTIKIKPHPDIMLDRLRMAFKENNVNILIGSSDIHLVQALTDYFQHYQMKCSKISESNVFMEELLDSVNSSDQYNLIVLDTSKNSFEYRRVLESIKSNGINDLKIALLVSFKDSASIGDPEDLGVDAVISKPLKYNEVMNNILKLFNIDKNKIVNNGSGISKENKLIGLKVLVAEDNIVNQGIVQELLESEGLIVDVASDGIEVVEKFNPNEYDLVFMDVNMPEKNGYEATREIKGLPGGNKIPIIAMTADISEDEKERCKNSGMIDFLEKPIKLKQIHEVVNRVMSGKQNMTVVTKEIEQHEEKSIPSIVIDMSYIHETLGDNDKVIKKTFELISKRFPTSLRDIRESIDSGDSGKLHRSAHGIKGFVNYFDLPEIKKGILELEKAGKLNNIQDARKIIFDLEPKLNEFLKVLRATLETL